MAWIDFLVCFFFGFLGVHKFKEKKIGIGFLYLFTGGLLGFGWLFDCIKYAIIALNLQGTPVIPSSLEETTKKLELPTKIEEVYGKIKTVLLWSLTFVLSILFIGFLPHISSFIALAGGLLILPLPKWQSFINKCIKGKVKIIVAIALVLFTFMTIPTEDATTNDDTPHNTFSTTEEPHNTTTPTFETIEDDTNSTTEALSETTIPPTTESTTPTIPVVTTPVENTTPTTENITSPSTEPPHVHTFAAATCTTPKTCSCGATEGDANGHTWASATCTHPRTCSACGATEGSATGHNYTDGKCPSCGGSDPNYTSEILVWIPTKGGTKYHTHAGCSNMDGPIQVTEEEAEAQGFTPCKRCH